MYGAMLLSEEELGQDAEKHNALGTAEGGLQRCIAGGGFEPPTSGL